MIRAPLPPKLVVALLAEGVDRNLQGLSKSAHDLVALLAEGVDRNAFSRSFAAQKVVALLAEGVDRNNYSGGGQRRGRRSPSSRRAWIEIVLAVGRGHCLLSPSSRRAWIEIVPRPPARSGPRVALLAEGVDRNLDAFIDAAIKEVALLAEGVDRNPSMQWWTVYSSGSPSSRRAWIEIEVGAGAERGLESPSSRRAWIEIP